MQVNCKIPAPITIAVKSQEDTSQFDDYDEEDVSVCVCVFVSADTHVSCVSVCVVANATCNRCVCVFVGASFDLLGMASC